MNLPAVRPRTADYLPVYPAPVHDDQRWIFLEEKEEKLQVLERPSYLDITRSFKVDVDMFRIPLSADKKKIDEKSMSIVLWMLGPDFWTLKLGKLLTKRPQTAPFEHTSTVPSNLGFVLKRGQEVIPSRYGSE